MQLGAALWGHGDLIPRQEDSSPSEKFRKFGRNFELSHLNEDLNVPGFWHYTVIRDKNPSTFSGVMVRIIITIIIRFVKRENVERLPWR